MKSVEKLIWLNDFIAVFERDKQALKRWNVIAEDRLPVLFEHFDVIIEELMRSLNDIRHQVDIDERREES